MPPQVPQGYSYPVANGGNIGQGNIQYAQNVRWNENPGQFKRVWSYEILFLFNYLKLF